MSLLSISGPVRQAFGTRNAAALSSGVGLPPDAQCWACGDAINLLAARPGAVTLSAVCNGPVTIAAFAHRRCGISRTFTPEDFARAASKKDSPIAGPLYEEMIIDGQPLGEAVRIVAGPSAAGPAPEIIRTIRCPVCWEIPRIVLSPAQALCETDGCASITFSLLDPPGKAIAEATYHDLTGWPETEGVLREPVGAGSDADRAREARIRHQVHAWGCICGDGGGCPVCPEVPPPAERPAG